MKCKFCLMPVEECCIKCPHCFRMFDGRVNNIKEIIVEGLFNKYNHKINFENDRNVSILIYPNGFGKTTILNFINFIISPNKKTYDAIKNIPFSKFECVFRDGTIIRFEKLSEDYIKQNGVPECEEKSKKILERLKKTSDKHIYMETMIASNAALEDRIVLYEQFFYKITIISDDYECEINFLDILRDVYNEGLQHYGITAEKRILTRLANMQVLGPISRKSISETTRLIKSSKNEDGTYNPDAFIYKSMLLEDANIFFQPEYLIKADKITGINYDTGLYSFIYMLLKRKQLKKQEFSISFIENLCKYITTSNCMSQFKHILMKLDRGWGYRNELEKRKDVFKRILNKENEFTHKIIDYSTDGFVIIQQGGENKQNYIINAETLSSGEKNLFALYFSVLFNSVAPAIFLIDEPEISLHIEWQEHIIDNMIEIANLTGSQIIICTHSPSVIDGNLDLLAKKEISEV